MMFTILHHHCIVKDDFERNRGFPNPFLGECIVQELAFNGLWPWSDNKKSIRQNDRSMYDHGPSDSAVSISEYSRQRTTGQGS